MPRKTISFDHVLHSQLSIHELFDNLIGNLETEKLDMHNSQNWTTKEQVFPISLQTSKSDTNLLKAPKILKKSC